MFTLWLPLVICLQGNWKIARRISGQWISFRIQEKGANYSLNNIFCYWKEINLTRVISLLPQTVFIGVLVQIGNTPKKLINKSEFFLKASLPH